MTLTTCGSEFFAGLTLMNSTGHYIQSQSTNECNGCDCDSEYCTGSTSLFQTSFEMESLPEGEYTIEITNACGNDEIFGWGSYNLFVICEHDTGTFISPQKETYIYIYVQWGYVQYYLVFLQFWHFVWTYFTAYQDMQCGEVYNGNIENGKSLSFHFPNYQEQEVTMNFCQSEYGSSGNLQISRLETSHSISADSFLITNSTNCSYQQVLPQGLYLVEIVVHSDNNISGNDNGTSDFMISVSCSPDFTCAEFELTESADVEFGAMFGYRCDYSANIQAFLDLDVCSSEFLTPKMRDQISNVFQVIESLGIGLELPMALLLLLVFHVITGGFMYYGLTISELDEKHDSVPTVIALLQISLLSVFLSFDTNNYAYCDAKFWSLERSIDAPSMYHVTDFILGTVFFFLWKQHLSTDHGCCCSKYVLWIWTFIVPLLVVFTVGLKGQIYIFGLAYYACQVLIPLVLLDGLTGSSGASFCKAHSKCYNCLKSALFVFCILIMVSITPFITWWFGRCSWYFFPMFANPFYVYSWCRLLCTQFKFLMIFETLVFATIFAFDFVTNSNSLCMSAVNVAFIVQAFSIPAFVVLLFYSFENLRDFCLSVFSSYLVLFDIYSDFIVIYYFFKDDHPLFALSQIAFIVLGQIVGAVADIFVGNTDDLSTADRLLSASGFGSLWFTVKWWEESTKMKSGFYGNKYCSAKYQLLRTKNKIWEMMYELFPGMVLQIYAALTTTVPTAALVVSISFSAISVSFTSIRYFLKLTAVVLTSNTESGVHEASTGKVGQFALLKETKGFILRLFIFILTDFVVRSVPLIIVLAICFKFLSNNGFLWYTFCAMYFGVFLIFEAVANVYIRTATHRNLVFIFKVFGVSLFSSFYSLLSSLHVLEDDALFAQSVIFKKFQLVHRLRSLLSCALCVVIVILNVLFSDDFGDRFTSIVWVLLVMYMLSILCNELSLRYIEFEVTVVSPMSAMARMRSISKDGPGPVSTPKVKSHSLHFLLFLTLL